MGRRLPLHSWGFERQIDDLARMPHVVPGELPWLRIDQRRDLRARQQHGRPRDAAPARPASASARRRRGARLRHEPLQALLGLRADLERPHAAGARTRRGRRHPADEPDRATCCAARRTGSRDRQVGRPAADLVEHGRRDRRRPGAPVRRTSTSGSRSSSRTRRSRPSIGTWRHSAEMHATTQLPEAVALARAARRV